MLILSEEKSLIVLLSLNLFGYKILINVSKYSTQTTPLYSKRLKFLFQLTKKTFECLNIKLNKQTLTVRLGFDKWHSCVYMWISVLQKFLRHLLIICKNRNSFYNFSYELIYNSPATYLCYLLKIIMKLFLNLKDQFENSWVIMMFW